MAEGFIDGATITSALTYLNLGRYASRPVWHQKSILEATYLMLHDNIHIIPRPKGTGGEHGDYAIVAREFRELIVDSARRREILRVTFDHSANYVELIKRGWDIAQTDRNFRAWADVQRHDRWKNQSLTYEGLFDVESIAIISQVSGYPLKDVKRIQNESADIKRIHRWIRSVESSEDAQIANAGWIIGGFMRGFFYDNLSAAENLQLLTHPFRSAAQESLAIREQHEVTNSEQALVKILIANALTETSKARRVRTWAMTVKKARDFINLEEPDLRNTTQLEAEERAIYVARKIDLQGGPRFLRSAIDIGLQTSVSVTGFILAPWMGLPLAFASRFATAAYKEIMSKTPGEQIGDALLQSNYQFRWLARSVAGRIERTLETDSIRKPN